MPIQFDKRAKKKKFLAYYYDKTTNKKVSLGMFETEEEAISVLEAKNFPAQKQKKEEKKINLNFGLIKNDLS